MTLSLPHRTLILTLTGALVCCAGLAACGQASDTKTSPEAGDANSADAGADTSAAAAEPTSPYPRGTPGGAMLTPTNEVAEVPSPETVLMTVDGVEVTQAGFERILNVFLRGQAATMPAAHLAAARAQLREQIEERLIMGVLLDKAVVAEDAGATDKQLAEEWTKISATLPPDTTIEQQLAKQGYDRAKAEQEIRQFLGHKNLHEKIAGEVPITDEEARAYYELNIGSFKKQEAVNARHILLMTKGVTPDVKAAREKQIGEIREKLIASKGEDFSQVAASFSDCPTKSKGGSLGDLHRGDTVPPFEKMAFSLDVGEISPVVETQFGYHIITVDKKTDAGTSPYEEVAANIKLRLAAEAQEKRVSAYHEKLRAAATVVRPDGTKVGQGDAAASKTEAAPSK